MKALFLRLLNAALVFLGCVAIVEHSWDWARSRARAKAPPVPVPPVEERLRLAEARLVGAGLVLYAQRNGGMLPSTIESLRPAYVGSSVGLSNYTLLVPSRLLPWADRLGWLIAEQGDPKQGGPVLIYASGVARFLGD